MGMAAVALFAVFMAATDDSTGLWVVAGAVVVGAVIFSVLNYQRYSPVLDYRLFRFAQANGLTYDPADIVPPLPGMIFHHGKSTVSRHRLHTETTPMVEFGNYQYVTQSGRDSTTHRWG